MVDNHVFIIFVFPTNLCLSIKKHAMHNKHRLAWALCSWGPRTTAQPAYALRRHCNKPYILKIISCWLHEVSISDLLNAMSYYLVNFGYTWHTSNISTCEWPNTIFLKIFNFINNIFITYVNSNKLIDWWLYIITYFI